MLLPKYAIASFIQSSLIANERLCEISANQRGDASHARQVPAVLDVIISTLAPSPIKRGADCDTERDPNGLSGKGKGDCAHRCAHTYPVASHASASRFLSMGFLSMECFAKPHSTVTLFARLRGLSTSVPLATAT